jgi:hypothetical protein
LELPDVPPAKLAALARYGLGAKAPALRELSATRRVGTLVATVRQLEVDAVDDALDLFDLLMATKLLAKAERLSNTAKLKSLPALRRAAGKIAQALAVLLGIPDDGGREELSLSEAWNQIEQVIPRSELTVALEQLEKLLPDQDDGDDDAEWRAELVKRYGSVTGFLGLLAQLELGAVDVRAPVRCGAAPTGADRAPASVGRGARQDAGERLVAAACVLKSRAAGRGGRSSRLRVLRAGGASPRAAAPRDLRCGRRPLG